jgi:recombination protein RecA
MAKQTKAAPPRPNRVDNSQRAVEEALALIEREHGKGTVRMGNEYDHPARISTGSLMLDAITHGGIPIGRWSRFYGGRSSGKSLMCWNVIREAQKMGMTVAYHNVEGQYDPRLVEAMGIDTSKLVVFEGTIIEDVCIRLRRTFSAINLHVIDSCSNASSMMGINAEPGTYTRGDKAQAWMLGFQKAAEYFREDNAVIYCDHIRMSQTSPGAVYAPGGTFMEHHASLILKFDKGGWLFYDKDGFLHDSENDSQRDTLTGRKEPDGFEVKITVEKSRVCPPNKTSVHWMDLGRLLHGSPLDLAFEYQVAMQWLRMTEDSGSYFTVPGYEGRLHGRPALRKVLRGDLTLQEEIRDKLMSIQLADPNSRRARNDATLDEAA